VLCAAEHVDHFIQVCGNVAAFEQKAGIPAGSLSGAPRQPVEQAVPEIVNGEGTATGGSVADGSAETVLGADKGAHRRHNSMQGMHEIIHKGLLVAPVVEVHVLKSATILTFSVIHVPCMASRFLVAALIDTFECSCQLLSSWMLRSSPWREEI
jgi:hypothetical protein